MGFRSKKMSLFIEYLENLGNKHKKIENTIFYDFITRFPIFKKKVGIILLNVAWGNIDKGFWL